MAGKKRSGLINDSRAYRSGRAYNYYYPHNALFTISYNGNVNTGGVAPTDSSSPYTSGTTVTVLGNTGSLVKSGYTFFGWNTKIDGSGTFYVSGNIFTIKVNTILYAQWTPIYTVSYNGNVNTGGVATTDSSSPYTSGTTVTVLGNSGSLVKSGYTFFGWNTEIDGSGTSYLVNSTFSMPSYNVTLYAEWISIVPKTLTYNGNGSTGGNVPTDGSSPYTTGSTVTVLGNSGSLVKTNYLFVFDV